MTPPLPPYTRTPITTPDGTPVIGWSGPATPTAPRCKCSHTKGTHYSDRKGRSICGSAACGCAVYRPKGAAAVTALHGVIDALDEVEYHAHPALSASGAKKLLAPSCPAKFKHDRDHGQAPKRAFDYGHAAHAKVLGVGAPVVVVQKTAKDGTKTDADDYRTKSAQEHSDEIRAAGMVPLLASEVAQIDGMAAALRNDRYAAALLDPDQGGKAEQSLFWHDDEHDVDRRCRIDWLREPVDGRLILVDYKSTVSAEPGAIQKAVGNYGYHLQDDWYRAAARALGLAEDVPFVFIFQEKTAPYVVTVVELDHDWQRLGRLRNDQAMQVFSECTTTGVWPGYSTDIELISPPPWATYELDAA